MGEFDWYRRIVLRSTPVRRWISCWLAPLASSVSIVIRKCDFKTFNSSLPRQKGSSVNVPPRSGAGDAGAGHGWGIFRWPQMGEFGRPPGRCQRCGGALKVIASIEDPVLIELSGPKSFLRIVELIEKFGAMLDWE